MDVSTIILAGGKGSRFQKTAHTWIDKLLAELDGKPLIKWVFESIEPVSDEIIIATNTLERGEKYKKLLGSDKVKVSVDKALGCKGPLLGIASSISFVSNDIVLIIPADMPFIKTESVKKLINGLDGFDVVVPLWFDGMTENLFLAVKKDYLGTISYFLCSRGYWSPSGIIRAAPRARFMDVANIVSSAKELININYFADLEDVKPRKELLKGEEVVLENDFFEIDREDEELARVLYKSNNVFLTAVVFAHLAMYKDRFFALKSVKAFDMEARRYQEHGIYGLMALAFLDAGKVLKSSGFHLMADQYLERSDKILKILDAYPKRRFI